ncbi:hypothetical protein OXX69_013262, partial [Metschnikowia pulcherrima]
TFDDEEEEENEREDEIANIELAGPNSNEIVHKTLNYLEALNDFGSHASEPLHPFELAQLGNLECEDAEEAKSLIPSLTNKVSDVQLKTLLTELRKYHTLS